jgi:hypothetical protein
MGPFPFGGLLVGVASGRQSVEQGPLGGRLWRREVRGPGFDLAGGRGVYLIG